MSFRHSAEFDTPVEEVFAWHARRGAIQRLLPPWQPVRVERESASLRDGTAVLRLPGGLRWAATHRESGYEEGRRFTDELATPGVGSVVSWRHTHSFSPAGDGQTRVTDEVETPVPDRLLREMFAYRTRQLSGDLAAHRRTNPGRRVLNVAVTGSSGLIGTAVCAFLSTGGHRVVRLTRSGGGPEGTRRWNPHDPAPDLLEGVDAVVHLAGASIAGRFTRAHKEEVRDSRIAPTRRLSELAARAGLEAFVSASAIGYYGADRGDEELHEESERGEGFLADLVADWEAATRPAEDSGVRVVRVRTGIVQSPKGGALQLQRLLFETGLGGRLGDGRQWTAWIGIDDMVDIYQKAILDHSLRGAVNAVAPGLVRNDEYTRALARVLRRPAVIPVPRFGPQLLLGREGASEVAEASQRVVPARLAAANHAFRWPDLEPAFRHVLGRSRGQLLPE